MNIKEHIAGLSRGNRGFTIVELIVVIAILGILAAIIIPSIMSVADSGDDEAKAAERHNLQTAVYAMLIKAGKYTLDNPGAGYYDAVDELAEIHDVTATNKGTTLHLDDYLRGGDYPLQQAYDIALDGVITVD